MIPEGSTTGKKDEGYVFRGHFLDLRTLAFALTDKSYTLEKACDDRCFELLSLKVDPRFETLQTDPRFLAALKRIGLS